MNTKKFTQLLMQWHKEKNKRTMPWKGETNPYKVWLSEIILQQTRVEQGWKYYENFVRQYPTVQQLAGAKDEEVYKLWEGLGYYSRCKNLLVTARLVAGKYNGKFPSTYEGLLSLKGVGPYTASAIASFCFNLPYPVVDGNVYRVLARVSGNSTGIDSTAGKHIFYKLAASALDEKKPGAYNQAIMDFGATVCKPLAPLCNECALQKICTAYKTATVNALPVKEKMLHKKTRWFTYFVFEVKSRVLLHRRTGNDIWQNLYEFYMQETDSAINWNKAGIEEFLLHQLNISNAEIIDIMQAKPQQLTHRFIKGWFIKIRLKKIPASLNHSGYEWAAPAEMKQYAFPKFIHQYLETKPV